MPLTLLAILSLSFAVWPGLVTTSLVPLNQQYLGEPHPTIRVGPPQTYPLECFQVTQPVLGARRLHADFGHSKVSPCSLTLMERTFGFSYGKPFIGQYAPPPCDFDRVVMRLVVTSTGRQFDRMALMFFGDTEVWRTSTAEPRPEPGIIWEYSKDMTAYLSMWKTHQKLIFDLGNLVDDRYTGSFNCTLTATFYPVDKSVNRAPVADMIFPIAPGKSTMNESSAWLVPQQKAVRKLRLPRNMNKAVVSISASGQQSEEFWWSNLLQSDVDAFNRTVGTFPGLSSFREVQLYIDGQLAGVQWPFPVVFTGGVSPALHRPIVGLQAFDMREHEIDVSPWLPILCDGEEHTLHIRPVGIYDDGQVAKLSDKISHYWIVTGKVFVWLDEEGFQTTGTPPKVRALPPTIHVTSKTYQNESGINEGLDYSTRVQRSLSVEGIVVTRKGAQKVSWNQHLTYESTGTVSGFGSTQINSMHTSGHDRARGSTNYDAIYAYPLSANQTEIVSPSNDLSIEAQLDQGFYIDIRGESVFPTGLEAFESAERRHGRFVGSKLSTTRTGQAAFHQSGDKRHSSGFGWTNQLFSFEGLKATTLSYTPYPVRLYSRNVSAVNDSVVFDHESVHGITTQLSGTSTHDSIARIGAGLFAPVNGRHTASSGHEAREVDCEPC